MSTISSSPDSSPLVFKSQALSLETSLSETNSFDLRSPLPQESRRRSGAFHCSPSEDPIQKAMLVGLNMTPYLRPGGFKPMNRLAKM